MSNPKIQEIQNLTLPELGDKLPSLTADELRELRELESKEPQPRKGALEDIDKALADLAEANPTSDQPADQAPPATASAAKPAADAPPAWQAPDYDGPITLTQASWRHANIKPVLARAKPVVAPGTKVQTK